jgi:hypothetical protein
MLTRRREKVRFSPLEHPLCTGVLVSRTDVIESSCRKRLEDAALMPEPIVRSCHHRATFIPNNLLVMLKPDPKEPVENFTRELRCMPHITHFQARNESSSKISGSPAWIRTDVNGLIILRFAMCRGAPKLDGSRHKRSVWS